MSIFGRTPRPRKPLRGRRRRDREPLTDPIAVPEIVEPTPKSGTPFNSNGGISTHDWGKASPFKKAEAVTIRAQTGEINTLRTLHYKPKFPYSQTGLDRLKQGSPKVIDFAMTIADFWDVSIIEVHRTPERQLELYNQGPHVTKVKFGKHNTLPSQAVDMAPYPIDWNDIDQFIRFTYFCKGVLAMKPYDFKNGADWDGDNDYADHTFLDWVHWEEL